MNTMYYNYGYQIPNDDLGKNHAGADPDGKTISTKSLQKSADIFDESLAKKLDHMF